MISLFPSHPLRCRITGDAFHRLTSRLYREALPAPTKIRNVFHCGKDGITKEETFPFCGEKAGESPWRVHFVLPARPSDKVGPVIPFMGFLYRRMGEVFPPSRNGVFLGMSTDSDNSHSPPSLHVRSHFRYWFSFTVVHIILSS